MTQPLKVSIVIPALNEGRNIAGAVTTAWETGADEVIVVDGGSTDGTAAIASQYRALVLTSPPGRARQMNAGAKTATGDVFLFQHADNRLDPEAVAQIQAALALPNVWGGAFMQRIEAPGLLFRIIERGNAFRVRWFGLPFGDQGVFVRRCVFQEVGGFPRVSLMEDYLLVKRLRARAAPVLLPGPIRVDPRRWKQHGVIRQTLRNWSLRAACRLGVAPDRLARFYVSHGDASRDEVGDRRGDQRVSRVSSD